MASLSDTNVNRFCKEHPKDYSCNEDGCNSKDASCY